MKMIPQHERESQIIDLARKNGHEFLGWLSEYKGKDSKMVIKCPKHGTWNPTASNYLRKGSCRKCLIEGRRTKDIDLLIKEKLPNHVSFVKFEREYKNQNSKVIIKCDKHGESKKTLSDIINKNSFCKACGIKRTSEKRMTGEFLASKKAIEKCNEYDYSFNGFVDGYKNKLSKLKVTCPKHGSWETSFCNFTQSREGCPSCGLHGYVKSKDGYLYMLKSKCGNFVKIGITNNPEIRLKELKYFTPFEFSICGLKEGSGEEIYNKEKEIHKMFDSAKMSGFNGATEWMVFDSKIEDEFIQFSPQHQY